MNMDLEVTIIYIHNIFKQNVDFFKRENALGLCKNDILRIYIKT